MLRKDWERPGALRKRCQIVAVSRVSAGIAAMLERACGRGCCTDHSVLALIHLTSCARCFATELPWCLEYIGDIAIALSVSTKRVGRVKHVHLAPREDIGHVLVEPFDFVSRRITELFDLRLRDLERGGSFVEAPGRGSDRCTRSRTHRHDGGGQSRSRRWKKPGRCCSCLCGFDVEEMRVGSK